MNQNKNENALTKLSEADLRALFDKWDTDNSGFLSFEEIKKVFGKNKVSVADPALQALFIKCDANKDGKMSWDEFKMFIESPECCQEGKDSDQWAGDKAEKCKKMPEEELKSCFKKYDKDNSGFVEFSEFKSVYEKNGSKMNPQAEKYFKDCDCNKDGKISFEEFRALINCS